ncbi:Cytosolic sulfotransferase 4, partial [Linum perenne]
SHFFVVDKGSRLFSTHIPYSYLPISIKQDCKLVYITRDPKDTYEDLRRDPKPQVRELASFLGSSFDRLKDLDVNKTGKVHPVLAPLLTNDLFFRRGEVGDWRNHLTAEVAKRIDDVTRVKFRSCGLYLHEEEAS